MDAHVPQRPQVDWLIRQDDEVKKSLPEERQGLPAYSLDLHCEYAFFLPPVKGGLAGLRCCADYIAGYRRTLQVIG